MTSEIAHQEKRSAALSSVIAAVGLTGFKMVVGLMTGSLGILAEAAHSGLDLVAAIVTLWAVHHSGKPADRDHLYGHGKIENLSALFETLLLLVTCIWIIHEATDRLLYQSVKVAATFWAFAVMITSIVVDVHRSRRLYRAAHKHQSQALQADAMHFSTDIWSSAVVLLGLVCLKLAAWFPALQVLNKADSIAALGVAVIVIIISGRMGLSSIQQLLDTAPAGMVEKIIAAVEAMPGVVDCHHVRLRHSGPLLFVDIHVLMDGNQTLRAAHALTDDIERHIQNIVPDSDVTVHPEPIERATQPSNSTTKS